MIFGHVTAEALAVEVGGLITLILFLVAFKFAASDVWRIPPYPVVAAINRNEFHLPATPYIISVPSEWHEGRTLPHRSGLPATNRVP